MPRDGSLSQPKYTEQEAMLLNLADWLEKNADTVGYVQNTYKCGTKHCAWGWGIAKGIIPVSLTSREVMDFLYMHSLPSRAHHDRSSLLSEFNQLEIAYMFDAEVQIINVGIKLGLPVSTDFGALGAAERIRTVVDRSVARRQKEELAT